jgi:hypothetical protein
MSSAGNVISDLAPSRPPSMSVSAADSCPVPPKAGAGSAATNSVVAKDGRDAPARKGEPSLGVSSLDLPAVSSDVAGLSGCIAGIDPDLDAAITALELSWLRVRHRHERRPRCAPVLRATAFRNPHHW